MSVELTVFYDGKCPLCCAEMDKLSAKDSAGKIALVNLHDVAAMQNYPDIEHHKAMQILHGYYQQKLLLGLDVTHRAWSLVGKGWLVAPLQFPVIKQLSHLAYLILAKYRQPISSALHRVFGIGRKHCDQGTCYTDKK